MSLWITRIEKGCCFSVFMLKNSHARKEITAKMRNAKEFALLYEKETWVIKEYYY